MTRLRSVLFAPASSAELVAKLPRSNPDAVVLDLEDAVAASAKADARAIAARMAPELRAAHPSLAIYVRVNPIHTTHFADDLSALTPVLDGVVVPKVEVSSDVTSAIEAIRGFGLDLPIFVGVETVAGVVRADTILVTPGVGAAYFGAEDYVADLGGVRTPESTEVLYARSRVAMAARMAGVPAVDQIVTAFDDEARFLRDAALGRSLGYRGKLCIHPRQVGWSNTSFSPSDAEVERAQLIIDAYDRAVALGQASIAFEGQMIDEPTARQARAIIRTALRHSPR